MSSSSPTYYPYLISQEDLAWECSQSSMALQQYLSPEDLMPLPGGRSGIDPLAARRILQKFGRGFAFRTMAFANLKGGIGKTTSALALATRAASLGYRTAILDLDPQASASLALGVEAAAEDPIFYDIWSKPADFIPSALYEIQPGLSLLPSSLENSLLDSALAHPSLQKNAVREVCTVLRGHQYDLVVLDCPPSLGAATISALSACHHLIIPLGPDAFSFKGLELTLAELKAIGDTFNLSAPEKTILFTRYDQRETVSRTALERLEKHYAEWLAPRPVRNSSLCSKVLEERKTIFSGFRQSPVREDYAHFARAVLS